MFARASYPWQANLQLGDADDAAAESPARVSGGLAELVAALAEDRLQEFAPRDEDFIAPRRSIPGVYRITPAIYERLPSSSGRS